MATSRWGKINHGQTYGLIADDIARRWATLRMGDYERLLLNHIREYSWARSTRRKLQNGSWPDALPFDQTINSVARQVCGSAAKETEVERVRKRLYEAVKTLHDDKFIVKAKGNAVLINVNVSEWRTKGREFINVDANERGDGKGEGAIGYALAAQNSTTGTTPKVSSIPDKPIRHTGQKYPAERIDVSGIPDKPIRHTGQVPIEERAQGDVIQSFKTEEDNTPVAPKGADDDKAPSDRPGVEADVERIILAHPKGNTLDAEPIVRASSRWLAEGYSASSILVAVGSALANDKIPPRSWGSYAHQALVGMQARGDEARARARPRASPEIPVVVASEDARKTAEYRAQTNRNRAMARGAKP